MDYIAFSSEYQAFFNNGDILRPVGGVPLLFGIQRFIFQSWILQ